MSAFLECRGLMKLYRDFTLGPLDMALDPGWFYALVGPNGAGKTTWLRMLLTLTVPTSGDLRLWGQEPLRHEVAVKRRLGFVLDQQFTQTPGNWKQVGRFFAGHYPDWDHQLYSELVARMSLDRRTKVSQFSKGNQNALALVCALAHRPEALILDEPTAGLDPAARAEAFDLLREYLAVPGRTVIFSTHQIEEVATVADQVLFLAGGRLCETGSPEELTERYHLVKTPTAAGPSSRLMGPRDIGPLTVGLTRDPAEWMGRPDTLVTKPSLDEVFVHRIRGERRHE